MKIINDHVNIEKKNGRERVSLQLQNSNLKEYKRLKALHTHIAITMATENVKMKSNLLVIWK